MGYFCYPGSFSLNPTILTSFRSFTASNRCCTSSYNLLFIFNQLFLSLLMKLIPAAWCHHQISPRDEWLFTDVDSFYQLGPIASESVQWIVFRGIRNGGTIQMFTTLYRFWFVQKCSNSCIFLLLVYSYAPLCIGLSQAFQESAFKFVVTFVVTWKKTLKHYKHFS